MRSKKPISSFAPHEVRRFILPITLASICIVTGVIIESILNGSSIDIPLIAYASIVTIYTTVNNVLVAKATNFREIYSWLNSILTGIGLGLLTYFLPGQLDEISHILIVLGIVTVAMVSGRLYAYLSLLVALVVSLRLDLPHLAGLTGILNYTTPFIISIIVVEAILRIMDTTQQHIHRLETINKVSRQIMLSLETEETLSLINATIQDVIEADTYFVGIVKDNELHLQLFYDDGAYFNGTRVPIEGTLSGWVIKNQKELFLPDLRQDTAQPTRLGHRVRCP